MSLVEQLGQLAPFVNGLVVVVVAIFSFVTHSVSKKMDKMTERLDLLSGQIGAQITTTAVVQSQLQTHTEQDRSSFHEIRNDLTTRIAQQQVQIENCRSALENLRLATMRSVQ